MTSKTTTFEHIEVVITTCSKKITVLTIYRSESSAKHKYSMDEFYDEFSNLLSNYQCCSNELIITGDFNFHWNKPNDHRTKRFADILDTFDLVQHISGPTHKSGNTLDYLITRKDSLLINHSISDLNSDHNCILFNVKTVVNSNKSKIVRSRKTKNINLETFRHDLKIKLNFSCQPGPDIQYLDYLVHTYNSAQEVLDKHAPETDRTIHLRKPNPWSNVDIKRLKVEKRKAEKKWRKSKLTVDWEVFKEKRNSFNKLLNDLRTKNLKSIIQKHKGNSKALFKSINSSLNRNQPPPLPDHPKGDKSLANTFNTFFDDKISKLRSQFQNTPSESMQSNHVMNRQKATINTSSKLKSLTEDEVKKLILSMLTKHCKLDTLSLIKVNDFKKIEQENLKCSFLGLGASFILVKKMKMICWEFFEILHFLDFSLYHTIFIHIAGLMNKLCPRFPNKNASAWY